MLQPLAEDLSTLAKRIFQTGYFTVISRLGITDQPLYVVYIFKDKRKLFGEGVSKKSAVRNVFDNLDYTELMELWPNKCLDFPNSEDSKDRLIDLRQELASNSFTNKQYTVESKLGIVNDGLYRICLKFDDKEYNGEGRSTLVAIQNAIENAYFELWRSYMYKVIYQIEKGGSSVFLLCIRNKEYWGKGESKKIAGMNAFVAAYLFDYQKYFDTLLLSMICLPTTNNANSIKRYEVNREENLESKKKVSSNAAILVDASKIKSDRTLGKDINDNTISVESKINNAISMKPSTDHCVVGSNITNENIIKKYNIPNLLLEEYQLSVKQNVRSDRMSGNYNVCINIEGRMYNGYGETLIEAFTLMIDIASAKMYFKENKNCAQTLVLLGNIFILIYNLIEIELEDMKKIRRKEIRRLITERVVSVMEFIFPCFRYEIVSEFIESDKYQFVARILLNGSKYIDVASTKRSAYIKTISTGLLLEQVKYHQIRDFPTTNSLDEPCKSLDFNQQIYDKIENLILHKFQDISKNENNLLMIAGIVMTRDLDFSNAEVIAVSSGTKCIHGGNVDIEGNALNDSHAEIIARRCLVKYLYNQLQYLLSNNNNSEKSIFVQNSEHSSNSLFKLKEGIEFHLYISQIPCGDFRYCSNKMQSYNLRVKKEADSGSHRVQKFPAEQTWDGIIFCDSLLTMSCTDKLTKWNVIGVQGAVLTPLIGPIYLRSITLGTNMIQSYVRHHVKNRIPKNIEIIQKPFYINQPVVGGTVKFNKRQRRDPPNVSISWTLGDRNHELINTITGKLVDGQTSSLCKRSLFELYYKIRILLGGRYKSSILLNYAQCKNASTDYQSAKVVLFNFFKKQGMGSWKKMPIEQDEFSISND